MRRRRIVAVVGIVALIGVGLVAVRGRAKTCPTISLGHQQRIYAISSKDIGPRLSCGTVRAVARESAAHHYAGRVGDWTIVYRRACQCRTASRVIAGRKVSFTFDATKRR